jgi:hypothetical protein
MASKSSSKRNSRQRPTVVVAGDVCIDWLSIPVEALVPGQDSPQLMNWQLQGGRHMYARRGGAWLTADFIERAAGGAAKVLKPEPEPNLENVPPERIIHSMLMLEGRDRERRREKIPHWVVTHFAGYAGPAPPQRPEVKPVEKDHASARIILLDDAGNGFRDTESAWPLALKGEREPLVVYKVRRPLGKGALWEHLKAFHLPRTVALLGANELRGEGGSISRGLSWERTATDLILSLAREPKFAVLRSCPFIIVTLSTEAAVLVRCDKDQISGAHLWYLPHLTEGASVRTVRGDMSGFGSVFAAAVTSALVKFKPKARGLDGIDQLLRDGIRRGLACMHNLLEEAFGPCKQAVPGNKSRQIVRPPEYPLAKVFQVPRDKMPIICDVRVPELGHLHSSKEMLEFRSWRILESRRDRVFTELAADVARRGAEKVFKDVPIGQFGKLTTLERSEIESYRSIRNLVREFLNNPSPGRPLCLAVFGAPGSGKSFGVTQVALDLDTEGKIEKLDFNVSQWNDPDYLVNALHRVRDHAIQGKVPLVFFDEFDSQFGSQRLGWLKYFLAPMQDGVFADGHFTHDIGKAIFVFAGGTADTFAEFSSGATLVGSRVKAPTEKLDKTDAHPRPAGERGSNGLEQAAAGAAAELPHGPAANERASQAAPAGGPAEKDDPKNVKLPDFVSRLRGHVDVYGLDPPVNTNLLRRALVLRSNVLKKFPTLKDGSGTMRIDDGVLRAFLQVPKYSHGARSQEAILDMSQLVGQTHFDPSRLPPLRQLDLHVDGNAFMALVQHQQILGAQLDDIAEGIHERYLREELDKKDQQGNAVNELDDPKRPALRHWKDLGDLYKKSNREQAANFPTLLAAVGCGFEEGDGGGDFEFSEPEINKLARMEHERWIQERRIKQPDHLDLVSWEELPEEEKEKDFRAVKAIPAILSRVGLRVIRLV